MILSDPQVDSGPELIERVKLLLHDVNILVISQIVVSQELPMVEDFGLLLAVDQSVIDLSGDSRDFFMSIDIRVLMELLDEVLDFGDGRLEISLFLFHELEELFLLLLNLNLLLLYLS